MKNSILSLPKRKAEFIEPMECAPVTKLLDAPGWVYVVRHIEFPKPIDRCLVASPPTGIPFAL